MYIHQSVNAFLAYIRFAFFSSSSLALTLSFYPKNNFPFVIHLLGAKPDIKGARPPARGKPVALPGKNKGIIRSDPGIPNIDIIWAFKPAETKGEVPPVPLAFPVRLLSTMEISSKRETFKKD